MSRKLVSIMLVSGLFAVTSAAQAGCLKGAAVATSRGTWRANTAPRAR